MALAGRLFCFRGTSTWLNMWPFELVLGSPPDFDFDFGAAGASLDFSFVSVGSWIPLIRFDGRIAFSASLSTDKLIANERDNRSDKPFFRAACIASMILTDPSSRRRSTCCFKLARAVSRRALKYRPSDAGREPPAAIASRFAR